MFAIQLASNRVIFLEKSVSIMISLFKTSELAKNGRVTSYFKINFDELSVVVVGKFINHGIVPRVFTNTLTKVQLYGC